MFRPFKGVCSECLKPRYIVVRKGLCNICNEKGKKKKAKVVNKIHKNPLKKTSKLFYGKKSTGEKSLFEKLWSEAIQLSSPNSPTCRCCGKPLGFQFSVSMFSHLLPKSIFPSYRLEPINIWIICFDCHFMWHNASRNDVRFTEKNIEYERLKQKYFAESK